MRYVDFTKPAIESGLIDAVGFRAFDLRRVFLGAVRAPFVHS